MLTSCQFEVETSLLISLRSELRRLIRAEQGRIYGTTSDGDSINFRENKMPAGSIGVLWQIDVENANIVQSASFNQKVLNLSREFGRLVRIAPVRLR